MSAVWSVVVVDAPHVAGGGPRLDLTTATNRALQLHKDDSHSASIELSLASPELAEIIPLATDLQFYRDSQPMGQLRVAPNVVNSTEDSKRATVTAISYKQLLEHRIIRDADCNAGAVRQYSAAGAAQDVALTVKDLLLLTQGSSSAITPRAPRGAYATLGIDVTTVATTGISRAATFRPGQTIRECIDQLAAGAGGTTTFEGGDILDPTGFEWDILLGIDGALHAYVWPLATGGRGSTTGFLFDYGGSVSVSSVQVDIDSYATLVRASGGTSVVAQTKGSSEALTGLWEKQVSITLGTGTAGVGDQQALNSAAAAAYAAYSRLTPSYNFTVTQGSWPRPGFGDDDPVPLLGDTCAISAPGLKGPVADSVRLTDISYTLTGDGEQISVTLGRPPTFSPRARAVRQQSYERELAAVRRLQSG